MRRWIRDYIGITLGALISAVALNMFLIPNKVAAGGVTGIAIVIYHVFGLPVGMVTMALSLPLLFLSVKILGGRVGLNTLYGAVILSLAIDLTAPYIPVLTQDLLLACLYGGILDGIGIGLVFKFRGTTAGTDLIAAMIHKLTGISLGQALLGVDFFVIALAGLVFGRAELALYALITLFIAAQVIDLVQEGRSSAKAFFIMTDQAELLADKILQDMDRGVTFLEGRGAYTGKPCEVIFCVVNTTEVTKLRDLIYETDQKAFVIVSDAHDVLGEGFKGFAGS